MKLWLSLLIVAFSGVATARPVSSVAVLKHRKNVQLKKKEMWIKKKFLAMVAAQQISAVGLAVSARSMSAGERRMWERLLLATGERRMWEPNAKDRRMRKVSLLDERQIRLESRLLLLSADDRRMRLESQLALFLAHIRSRLALGQSVGVISGNKAPRLVYYEDSGSSRGMPDYRRGGSSSTRHPADIDHSRGDYGPDGRGGGPVDSPPPKDKGKSSSPDRR